MHVTDAEHEATPNYYQLILDVIQGRTKIERICRGKIPPTYLDMFLPTGATSLPQLPPHRRVKDTQETVFYTEHIRHRVSWMDSSDILAFIMAAMTFFGK